MNGCELMEELARLKEDRDRLIEEAKALMRERDELRMVLDDERAHCEEFKAESDRAQNDVNLFRKLYEKAIRQRDHARTCAEEMRDLYAAEIDESIAAFPFPWVEDEHGADRDGQ